MRKLKKWLTLNVEEENNSADSILSPVMPNQRRATASLVAVSVGWAFALTGMIAGAGIAPTTNLSEVLWSIIIGNFALFAISFSISYVAYKTGCSTPLIFKLVYGKTGMIVPCILVIAVGLGWQASLTGMVPDTWVGSEITPLYIVIGIIAGILVLATLLGGIKWLEIISWPAVFFIVVVGVIAIVQGYTKLGGMTGVETAASDLALIQPVSFADRIDIIIGAWIVGAMFAGDFTRFSKNTLSVFLFVAIAFIITQPFLQIVGILGLLAFDNYNPVGFVGAVGSLMWLFVGLGMTIAIWTTANNNLYFTQVALSNVFKLPRKVSVVIIGVVGGVAGAVGVFNYVGSFIGLLAAFVPPVLGPVILDFYILSKGKYDVKLLDKIPDYNIPAITAYIMGIIVPFIYSPSILPAAIWGIILSVFTYSLLIILFKFAGKKVGYMTVSHLATETDFVFSQNLDNKLTESK
ncbi:cytosine permease [Bacillus sp. JJ1521]|uniref:purine-cytosine permease family protein n=1 Tax=Bacillus sp. JJ1521 TaxID=3122957 RepID=UPI00300068D6